MGREERLIEVKFGQDVDVNNQNLVELIRLGYNYDPSVLNEEFINQRGQAEYKSAQVVYFTKANNKEIASLSIIKRPNIPSDAFWKSLRIKRQDLSDPNLLAIYMQGIVVHPTYRNEGIAGQMLKMMTDYYNPSVILGQTKTPKAAKLRSKILSKMGYRTFYGFCEITPGCDYSKENEGQDFIRSALDSEHFASGQIISDKGLYFVEPNILPSYLPDTKNFPLEIQRAFQPVINAQKETRNQKVASSVLVSVKSSFL